MHQNFAWTSSSKGSFDLNVNKVIKKLLFGGIAHVQKVLQCQGIQCHGIHFRLMTVNFPYP